MHVWKCYMGFIAIFIGMDYSTQRVASEAECLEELRKWNVWGHRTLFPHNGIHLWPHYLPCPLALNTAAPGGKTADLTFTLNWGGMANSIELQVLYIYKNKPNKNGRRRFGRFVFCDSYPGWIAEGMICQIRFPDALRLRLIRATRGVL